LAGHTRCAAGGAGTISLKITVVTAVFNGGPQIGATLSSVAAQDFSSVEHIVIDGASSDETMDVIRRHLQRVARVVSEPDAGAYDAFNKGLRLASGDIVGFLGCGDTYSSGMTLSTIAERFSDPKVDAVFGDLVIVGENDPSRILRRYRSKYFSPKRLAFGFMPAHPTLFLRREIYTRVGEYSTRYRIASDFEMCLRVFANTPAHYVYIPEVLVRMRSGGLSNKGWKSKMAITREMQLACALNGVGTNWLKLCARLPFKLLETL
jgi:glycosyltransferase involved in cell wall biosynthesis